jgi:alkylhydroperoxidase family enzyme
MAGVFMVRQPGEDRKGDRSTAQLDFLYPNEIFMAECDPGRVVENNMTTIPLIEDAEIDPSIRQAFENIPGRLNIHRIFAHAPSSFESGRRHSAGVMGGLQLGPVLRQIIVLQTAHLEGGVYEWVQHEPVALSVGVTQGQIDAITAGETDSEVFDNRAQLLLKFVTELVNNAAASEETTRAALKLFTSRQLVEAMLVCCHFMAVTRISRTAGIDPDAPTGGLANVGSVDRGESWFQQKIGVN